VTWTIGAAAAVLAAALAAVGAALLLWRARRPARVESPEVAAAAAEGALPGFRTAGAVLGADGRAALVVGEDGRVALATSRRSALAVREIGWAAIRAAPDGLLVEAGGRPVAVTGVDVLDVRRMAPAGIGWRLG
jgi:hypothetical protein